MNLVLKLKNVSQLSKPHLPEATKWQDHWALLSNIMEGEQQMFIAVLHGYVGPSMQ